MLCVRKTLRVNFPNKCNARSNRSVVSQRSVDGNMQKSISELQSSVIEFEI